MGWAGAENSASRTVAAPLGEQKGRKYIACSRWSDICRVDTQACSCMATHRDVGSVRGRLERQRTGPQGCGECSRARRGGYASRLERRQLLLQFRHSGHPWPSKKRHRPGTVASSTAISLSAYWQTWTLTWSMIKPFGAVAAVFESDTMRNRNFRLCAAKLSRSTTDGDGAAVPAGPG